VTTLHRFFVDPAEAAGRPGELIAIPSAIARQVVRVLRLRDGEPIVLLDGLGGEVRCRIDAGRSALRIEGVSAASGEPRHRLTIGQSMLKGDGLERVIQQGTELGVAAFKLVVAERSIVRDLSERRLERLRSVAREAAEQSGRGSVPMVEAPRPLGEALGPGAVLLDAQASDGERLGRVDRPALLLVGPEGGFAPEEVAAARNSGARIAWLGPRVLRAESVAIAAAAVVLWRTGDFA
jgi:16S rRNA (uracil1498-N3)-methyltransferase